jgi:hypothetical protein
MQFAQSELSTSLVPQAMLRGEMNAQAAPMFLRSFESFHREIPQMYNRFLQFFSSRVSDLLDLDPVGCVHQSAATADNIGIDSMLMAAGAQGQISSAAWMPRLGINPATERKRKLAEARAELEMAKKVQELKEQQGYGDMIRQNAAQSMMQAAQPQQGPGGQPGGAPAGPAPGQLLLPSEGFMPPQDVAQVESQAVIMSQMLGGMDQMMRDHELTILRETNSTFHAAVIKELENLRNAAAAEGRQMIAPQL